MFVAVHFLRDVKRIFMQAARYGLSQDPFHFLKARDENTEGERAECCMQAFPRHPPRRSRDTYRDDESDKSRDQQAEIAWPEVAVRWEPALVTRPNSAGLSLESP
jgi:hypothetical protein